jgi:hypothetical protein
MKSTAIFYTAVILLVAAIGRPVVALAQDSPEQQLTGGSSREWVFRRIVVSLGPGNSCTSGETDTFSADHSLTVQECKNGHLDTKRFSWHVTNVGSDDTVLVVDGLDNFLILFRDTPDGVHWMRLRTRGKSPIQPTVDKEFRSNED